MPSFSKKDMIAFLEDKFILIVEPSTNYRTSIKQFLINLKAPRIKIVTTVAEARREMLTNRIGLFIVEWSLNDVNGIQFCRSIRKEEAYKETPFLLLSVENLRKDIVLASEVKIDGYLLKPFSYEDFCQHLMFIMQQQRRPNPLDTIIERAEEKLAQGDTASAMTLFEHAIQQQPRSAKALTGYAKAISIQGDNAKAVSQLKLAIDCNPDYITAYRVLLDIYEKLEDRTGLIQTAGILHALSPDNPRYTLILARSYLETNEVEGSELYFRKTISLSPRLAEAYKGLGNLYMMQQEYEKAMRSFKKALDLDQDDVSTLNALGLALVRLGKITEGIERYLMALRLDSRDPRVLFNIGQAFEKKRDLEKARSYYEQALVHQPNFAKAQRCLKRIEQQLIPQPPEFTETD